MKQQNIKPKVKSGDSKSNSVVMVGVEYITKKNGEGQVLPCSLQTKGTNLCTKEGKLSDSIRLYTFL